LNQLNDVDGAVRDELLLVNYYGKALPSMSLLAAASSLNLRPSDIKLNTGESVQLGKLRVKTDEVGRMLPQFYKGRDYLTINANTNWRDPYFRLRQTLPSFYRSLGPKHATADINASYRFTPAIEALAQIQNIADYYQEDVDVGIATIGRQSKVGVRVRF